MKTKSLDRKTATKSFIYDLLKWPKKTSVDNNSIQDIKKNYLDTIKKQIAEELIDFNLENLSELYWIDFTKKNNNTCPKINCPKLYHFIKNNANYIFVRNSAKGGILRYFYIDGYYKLVSNEDNPEKAQQALVSY